MFTYLWRADSSDFCQLYEGDSTFHNQMATKASEKAVNGLIERKLSI